MTLASDVGWAYAAQMKAVLLRTLSAGRILDLAHDLPAHAIGEAAFVVRAMARSFPAGTVHLVVVDPGVGGRRAPIVVQCSDGSCLVGPDNGVLYPLAKELGGPKAYRIDRRRLGVRARVGTTFDGRDLFAPAAARLAEGTSPSRLGPRIAMRQYTVPEPRSFGRGARGEVVHVDRFGNLITNVPTTWVPPRTRRVIVSVAHHRPRILSWATSYEALGPGRFGAIGSSFGTVELAQARGRLADRWRARVGHPVQLRWGSVPRPGPDRK